MALSKQIEKRTSDYYYTIWDSRKGFIVCGTRQTEVEAEKAANAAIKSLKRSAR